MLGVGVVAVFSYGCFTPALSLWIKSKCKYCSVPFKMKLWVCAFESDVLWLVAQLSPILCNPMDCSPPGTSVHGDSPGKNMTNLDIMLKSGDITLPTKVHIVNAMVFPVVVYGRELDHEEGWVPKNWCFVTGVVLEKTVESPLNCKEIQPVHPKGNQSWMFVGRTDAEAETPILWPPDVKN